MKDSETSFINGGVPPGLEDLPLAWDWRFCKIDDKSLCEFAKHIHWMIDCDDSIGLRDATNLLRELVEIVLYKTKTGEKIDCNEY